MGDIVSTVDMILSEAPFSKRSKHRTVAFLRWLEAYHELWRRSRDDIEARVFSLNVSVTCIHEELEMIHRLADVSQKLAITCNLLVDAVAFSLVPAASVASIASHSGLAGIGLSFRKGSYESPNWSEFLEALETGRPQINLLGDYDLISSSGLLNSARTLNLVIYPTPSEARADSNVVEPSPCKHRFRMVVSADGFIFPCAGLVGFGDFAISNVYSPFDGRVYQLDAASSKYASLYNSGPMGSPVETAVAPMGLPPICFVHRQFLLNG